MCTGPDATAACGDTAGMKEANACHEIREGLFQKGYDIPICADMHFQPKVAIKTAEAVEKIRINPGNFADGRKEDEATKARAAPRARLPRAAARQLAARDRRAASSYPLAFPEWHAARPTTLRVASSARGAARSACGSDAFQLSRRRPHA